MPTTNDDSGIKTSAKMPGDIGRPTLAIKKRLDYRVNCMLDDREERIFLALLSVMHAKEGKPVSGSEFMRRLLLPLLTGAAKNLKLPAPLREK